jgi:hypothetical protein
MKKLILLSLGLICYFGGFSQTVNDVPLNQIDVEYVQLIGKGSGRKVKVDFDFGQKTRAWTSKDTELKDENNKTIKFNSMIDAMNFMSSNGYDFITAFAYKDGSDTVYHYLLRKRE